MAWERSDTPGRGVPAPWPASPEGAARGLGPRPGPGWVWRPRETPPRPPAGFPLKGLGPKRRWVPRGFIPGMRLSDDSHPGQLSMI
jgi:hypothetical protein